MYISFLKMTEKPILITPMHGNTPYFLIFPFFEPLGGPPTSPWRRPWCVEMIISEISFLNLTLFHTQFLASGLQIIMISAVNSVIWWLQYRVKTFKSKRGTVLIIFIHLTTLFKLALNTFSEPVSPSHWLGFPNLCNSTDLSSRVCGNSLMYKNSPKHQTITWWIWFVELTQTESILINN